MVRMSADCHFGATSHLVKGEDGVVRWESPLVDARKGRFRTALGRMGTSAMGVENDKYGDDPYAAV
jgi:hypothetical protein